jgi:exopolyphosphatase/guanosine-5'-triphosphate,3'-diphosphate pyrophosphatase
MTDPLQPTHRTVAVLDMGASAIRLVIGDVGPDRSIRVIDEASRGVLLGRDTFSSGVIRPRTADAALAALDGFRAIIESYGVTDVRAVATSAVREARNGDLFLDRIRARSGIAFDTINEAEEARFLYLAVRESLKRHAAIRGAWTLLVEVGGGSTSLTLLRRGQPERSSVYALGAVRFRQRLDLPRYGHDLQVALLKRVIANVIDEIRIEFPLRKVTQVVAVGGDIRFAARQILAPHEAASDTREVPREALLAFSSEVEALDDESLVARFRLPAVEAETLMPSLLIYSAVVSETSARQVIVSDASMRTGMLLDLAEPEAQVGARDFEQQVLASAEALGHRFRFDRAHGRHVAALAVRLFDELREEHRLSERDRLLLQTAALLHDIGVYVGLRGHHRHSQYILAASQIFGLSSAETAVVANIARYHRRSLPQRSHLPFLALDEHERMLVNKLAALLRVANALDAEHLQKVRDLRLVRGGPAWVLELNGTGDITMEQVAATARADLFVEVFGRELVMRPVAVGA